MADDFHDFEPNELEAVVNLSTEPGLDGRHCRLSVSSNGAVQPFEPSAPIYTFRAIANGELLSWLDLFVDGVSVRTARAHSTTAVYMRLSGMPERHNARSENIST